MENERDTTTMRLTVLGCRGSLSVSGSEFAEFVGHTSCYLFEPGEDLLILDAGSGLIKAPAPTTKPATMLLSHPHADHLVGLGMYAPVYAASLKLRLYVPARSDEEAKRIIDSLYSPPLWPVKVTECKGLQVAALPDTLEVGALRISHVEGNHPGGCRAYKIVVGNKSLVYASDYEYSESSFGRLVELCRGAALVLFDAQYSEREYEAHRGFGHATPQVGLELMRQSGAAQMLLIHHDPHSSDDTLLLRERALGGQGVRFAREGEVITI